MPKSNSIPPSILSFVRKSNGDGDEDRALLIPSSGSSFDLQGDSEYLLPKSTSSTSKSSRSSRGSGGHRRKRSSPKQRDFGLSHSLGSHLSERSASSTGSPSPSNSSAHGHQINAHHERQYSSPLPQSERRNTQLRKFPSADVGYDFGYDSTDSIPRGLPPIAASSSLSDHGDNSTAGGGNHSRHASSGGASEIDASGRSHKSNSIHTIHSGRSYRSQKSASSNRSGKSGRQRRKWKRQERRREWLQRWRKRQVVGSLALTIVYSLLFAYTCLVTLGPLALQFFHPDAVEWCPYYWDDQYAGNDSPFSLNIDQLQKAKQSAEEDGSEQRQRRRLQSQRYGVPVAADLKGIEINLLKRTSKDVHASESGSEQQTGEEGPVYENPDYNSTPCHLVRVPSLFYLTLEECDLSRRMAASVLLGGFIGYERRAADRPAGIRTMSLVALGSCFFTISSQLAFRDSPMTWDSSRVTAAIPSGVGFLGAGLIWKGSLSDGNGGEVHQVHGITTAASVWLAAAVGAGAGGALYAVSAYSTALVIVVLRFGPRLYFQNDRGFEDDEEDEEEEEADASNHDTGDAKYNSFPEEATQAQDNNDAQTHGYEMQHKSTNDTTALSGDSARYGSTDIEQNTVAELLQQEQRRQIERMSQFGGEGRGDDGPLSWLTKLLPGKGRQQPLNPYQEITRDREIMRLLKKKRSMNKMSSRPSFCT